MSHTYLLLLITTNVTRTQFIKYQTLFTALRQCWTVSSFQTPPLNELFNEQLVIRVQFCLSFLKASFQNILCTLHFLHTLRSNIN